MISSLDNKSSHGPILKLVNHNIRFFNEHVSDHINAEQPFGRKVRVTVVFDWLRRDTELFDESLFVKDVSEEEHNSGKEGFIDGSIQNPILF